MLRALLFSLIIMISVPATAQEQGGDDFPQRLALAQQMLEIRPAKRQLESAINSYISNYMFAYAERDQQIFRTAMLKVMKPKGLEKVTIDAYAETFTLDELTAMVEYYSKPEAQSARKKQGELDKKIAPEIVQMLDKALMKVRTRPKTP